MGANVLVVDDDPHILRMLTDVLGKRGFVVDVAKDGEEAYERALARAPDLLVTDVMMPRLDGWSLVRKLRLEPRLATLPVIFLTALSGDDDRIKAFRLGADDYVNKPFKLQDIVVRVEKVLGPAKAPAKPAAPAKPVQSAGLNGDLAQVGLSTLLVLIEMERKTGVLTLTAADGRSGKMAVREGKVLDSQAPPKTGAESVYLMLTWSEGRFEFVAREVAMEDKIGQSTTHLLMEGARLMDEASSPEAESQLNEEAIAEWQEEERAPIVAAAKLADVVRRNARASLPPYTQFSSPGIRIPPEDVEDKAEPAKPDLAKLAASGTTEPAKPVPVAKAEPDAKVATEAKPATKRGEGERAEPATNRADVDKAEPKRADVDKGETTKRENAASTTKRAEPARRRGASAVWLILALLVGGAGAATFAIKPPAKTTVAAVDVRGDAAAIGATLDRGADTAQMRATGFASAPMLRTGIETDASTLQDMATNEGMLQPAAGEAIEIFQTRDGATTSLLRTPATARALALDGHARAAATGNAVEVIATAPIKSQQGANAGIVAVSVGVDLKDAASALSSRVLAAKVVGLDRPLELVPAAAGAQGDEQTVQIASKAAAGLSLVVMTAAVPVQAKAPEWLEPARYGAFALAGLLLLMYLVMLARR